MLIPFGNSIFKFKDRLDNPRELKERSKPTRRKQHNRIIKPKPKPIKNAYTMNTRVLIPVFKSWFEENKKRFQIPITISEIESNRINMVFPTFSEVISAHLYFGQSGYLEINVTVYYQDIFWDILLSYDAKLMRNKDGCFCNFCLEREIYPDIETLAIKHTFEFFLNWCNETFCGEFKGLAFYGDDDEGTYTWLVRSHEDTEMKVCYFFTF